MARRLVVQPQSDLDIQAAAVWYEDQRSAWARGSLTNSTWCSNVSRTILDNSRVSKATFTVLSSATFLTARTSSQSQMTSKFWRFCTCTENLICGRAVIDDSKQDWGRVSQSHIWRVGLIPLVPLVPHHHRRTPCLNCGLVRDRLGRLCSAGSLADRSSVFQRATSLSTDSIDRG